MNHKGSAQKEAAASVSETDVLPESDTNSTTKVNKKSAPKTTSEDSDYLLPVSDTRKIIASDLDGMRTRDLT